MEMEENLLQSAQCGGRAASRQQAQARRAARHQARFLKRSGETVAACALLLSRLEAEILAEAECIASVRFLFGATPHSPKVRGGLGAVYLCK